MRRARGRRGPEPHQESADAPQPGPATAGTASGVRRCAPAGAGDGRNRMTGPPMRPPRGRRCARPEAHADVTAAITTMPARHRYLQLGFICPAAARALSP
jgi:hypothetical protein